MRRRARWIGCCAVLGGTIFSTGWARAQAPGSPVGRVDDGRVDNDSRDDYSLLDRHLVNRQLFEQLNDEDQSWRLGNEWDSFAVAADTAIATQQTFGDSEQSRFHGYFVADLFAAARIVDGLDANLNLMAVKSS